MGMKELYEAEVKVRLEELDAQIQEMAESADKAGAAVQAESTQQLEALKTQRNQLQEQYAELHDASVDAWTELRNGFDQALADFTDAVHNARSQFKQPEKQQTA
jgi:DNA repair exonuclease SbcCD ATPase subunit